MVLEKNLCAGRRWLLSCGARSHILVVQKHFGWPRLQIENEERERGERRGKKSGLSKIF